LKQGEKIFKLENALQKSYSSTFDYLQKNFEKDLQKYFTKTKHVVQAWSNMLKIKKQSMHIL
jgi:type III secretory pathway component EscR